MDIVKVLLSFDFKARKKICVGKADNCPLLLARKKSKHASVYKFMEGSFLVVIPNDCKHLITLMG